MRALLVAFLLAASGCSEGASPPVEVARSPDTVDAAMLRDIVQRGDVWCSSFEPETQSCRTVERIRQVSGDGYAIEGVWLLSLGQSMPSLKVAYVRAMHFADGGRACGDLDQQLQTVRAYRAATFEAKVTRADQAVPQAINDQVIAATRAQRAAERSENTFCAGWRIVNQSPLELQQTEYIDGVPQPSSEPTTIRLFAIDTDSLTLRHRGD